MILYVIGGHGSGKSTAVRRFMKFRALEPVYDGDRRRPLGYADHRVFVVGHYEIPNGGSDTVRPLYFLEQVMRQWAETHAVIAEGVGQAGFVNVLKRLGDVRVVQLSTPLEVCLASVRSRGHKLSRDGVERSWRRCENAGAELSGAGVPVFRVSRRGALKKMEEVLS